MASATGIQSVAMTGTVRADGDTVRADAPPVRDHSYYYRLWRTRPSHPWHSEEFDSQTLAHRRYFELIERGVEAYLEKRH